MGRFYIDGTATYVISYDTQNPDGVVHGQRRPAEPVDGWRGSALQEPRVRELDARPLERDPGEQLPEATTTTCRGTSTVLTTMSASYTTYDLQGTYALAKSWRFTLGVRNLFDQPPPYTNNGAFFQAGYDPSYGDPRDRFVYGVVTYSYGK